MNNVHGKRDDPQSGTHYVRVEILRM
jgi:hypothetical protein